MSSEPTPTPLIPPDHGQCQAEKRSYHPFQMGGAPHRVVRCSNKPVFLATEAKPDEYGRYGAMTLCAECGEVAMAQLPEGFAVFMPL